MEDKAIRSLRSISLPAAAAALVVGAPAWALTPPAAPTRPVELSRYFGRWYEIARVPNLFEKGLSCAAPTADYQRGEGGEVKVVQTCHQGSASGAAKAYRASGKILDPGVNARLRLTFYMVMSREYWVLDHASDYDWAIVGDPTGKYLWVLARTPGVGAAVRTDLLQRVKELGYDVARLEFPVQK